MGMFRKGLNAKNVSREKHKFSDANNACLPEGC